MSGEEEGEMRAASDAPGQTGSDAPEAQATGPDPAELARLEAAVASLRPMDREIFLAHRLDAMSYAAIAAATGLSERRVERAMARALAGISRHRNARPPRRRRWWPF